MKKLVFILLISVFICSCNENQIVDITGNKEKTAEVFFDSTDVTNDLFDNTQTKELRVGEIYVGGEVEDSGVVDLTTLQLRSKLVKETLLSGDDTIFIGAYRYDGYSLHDVLNKYILKKKNEESFKPFVDAYIEVENDNGERAVFSWGEVFYPNDRHEILLATRVMNIVPIKSKDMWPIPEKARIIAAGDLLTQRNISNPVKITVKSHSIDLPVVKDLKPLYSPVLYLTVNNVLVDSLKNMPDANPESIHTIFYGKGRGIHSTQPHYGIYLKEYLMNHIKCNPEAIQQGVVIIAAVDGYRAVFSLSEICNRNDQAEVLLMCNPQFKDKGIYRVIPAGDFFSDRAIKGISDIYYFSNR